MNLRVKKLTQTGLCIALGIVLPLAFHAIPNAGKVFLPMHIPVLICGMICGPVLGLTCGILTPLLSSLLTGMPPMAFLPSMMVELAIYGLMSGLLIRVIKTKNFVLNCYIALIASMIIGRIFGGVVTSFVLSAGKYTIKMWMTGYFVTGLFGILIQLVLIPLIINALLKSKLIDIDYYNIWGIGSKRIRKSREIFDSLAPEWDNLCSLDENGIEKLIKLCNINPSDKVLDIACGTGIIDNAIIELGAKEVMGIDVSSKMIELAEIKNKNSNVFYETSDFYKFDQNGYSKAIIFNAYPHFINREDFARKLSKCLSSNGEFFIIHSESKEVINSRHNGKVSKISKPLMDAKEEQKYFTKYFDITNCIDNQDYYLLSGKKK